MNFPPDAKCVFCDKPVKHRIRVDDPRIQLVKYACKRDLAWVMQLVAIEVDEAGLDYYFKGVKP